jgi:hypothetical protein
MIRKHVLLTTCGLFVKTCPNFCSVFRRALSGTKSSARIFQNGRNLPQWKSSGLLKIRSEKGRALISPSLFSKVLCVPFEFLDLRQGGMGEGGMGGY